MRAGRPCMCVDVTPHVASRGLLTSTDTNVVTVDKKTEVVRGKGPGRAAVPGLTCWPSRRCGNGEYALAEI